MSKEKHKSKKDDKHKSKKDEKHKSKKGEVSKIRKEEISRSMKEETSKPRKDETPKSRKEGTSEQNKEEISAPNKEYEFGKGKVDRFNQLVKKNKDSGKNWYHGLEGKWWWGMSENDVRTRLAEVEQILGNIQNIYTDSQKAIDVEKGLEDRATELVKNTSENIDKENVVDSLRLRTEVTNVDPKIIEATNVCPEVKIEVKSEAANTVESEVKTEFTNVDLIEPEIKTEFTNVDLIEPEIKTELTNVDPVEPEKTEVKSEIANVEPEKTEVKE
jgi:hypothetical protein